MKLNEAHPIVKNCIKVKTPVMLWGAPGIGKSSLIHQISNELRLRVIDLRLAQLEPTDLRGVPMPNRETGRAEWYLPAFWPVAAVEDGEREVVGEDGKKRKVEVKAGCGIDGPGLVFLDEIEKAPVSVKNASLQLVLDRAIGSYKLPDDWTIVCAGNREEDGAFSQTLGTALANRMLHLEIEPDLDAWAAWARDNGVAEDIIAFLHFKPELVYKNTGENAFPTPRSWAMGSNLIKMVKNQKEQAVVLSAAVGKGASSEFTVYNNVYKNVNPEEILDDGKMPKIDEKDQAFKYAVTMAVAFYLRKKGLKDREENTAKFMNSLSPELRVVFLKNQTLATMEKMAKSSFFKDRVREIMKIAVVIPLIFSFAGMFV